MDSFFKWLNNKQSDISLSEAEANFDELEEIWETAGDREPLKMPDKAAEWQRLEGLLSDTPPQSKKFSFGVVSKIAATLIFIITSGALLYMLLFNSNTYESGNSSRHIVLADGSEVFLNKNSELVVSSSFNETTRDVQLKGEGYFEVTKGKYPFIIKTDVAQVKVVGTEFNVKARGVKVELAVNEGIVDFSNLLDLSEVVRVERGFLSTCQGAGAPNEPQAIQFSDYPGWMYGKLHFQNNTLTEVCEELGVNFGIEIEVVEDAIGSKIISGTLEGSDPDDIIQVLSALVQGDYRVEQDKYVIY